MNVLDIGKQEYTYFAPLIPQKTSEELEGKDEIILLGLEDEGTACGVLAGWLEDERLYLCHIYVSRSYRNRGGASLLLEKAESLLAGSGRGNEIIAAFGTALPGHKYLAEFFMKRGYHNEPDGNMAYCARIEDILRLPVMQKLIKGKSTKIKTLSELGKTETLLFVDCLNRELGKGTEKGLDKELTVISFDSDGRLNGYMANTSSADRQLITQTYTWVDRGADAHTLLYLIGGLLRRAERLAPMGAVFCLQPVDGRTEKLMRYLLDEVIRPASVYLMKRVQVGG